MNNQKGYILILTLLMLVALTVAGLGAMMLASSDIREAGVEKFHEVTFQTAVTGLNELSALMQSYPVQPPSYPQNQVDVTLSNNPTYLWYKGHYSQDYTSGSFSGLSLTSPAAIQKLAVSAPQLMAGQEISNALGPQIYTQVYPIVVTGVGPNSSAIEVEKLIYLGM